jgi:hypothetical protein
MMTQDKREDLLTRLGKLQAMAKSAADIGNDEEAAIFAAKVQELLTKYKLTLTEVTDRELEIEDPFGEETIDSPLGRKSTRVKWAQMLATTIARTNFCRLLVIPSSNAVIFVGRDSDRAVAAWLWRWLVELIDTKATAEYHIFGRRCRKAGDVTQARGFRQGYIIGFVRTVRERLIAQYTMQVQTVPTSLALVTTEKRRLSDWMHENMSTSPAGGLRGGRGSPDGYRKGASDGDSQNLNPNVVQGTGARRLGAG